MSLPYKCALVTGGAGFIGSHLVEALIAEGVETRVVDNLTTGHLENLPQLEKGLTLINGDICDAPLISGAMKGVDVVFHLAAVVSVPESVAEPVRTAQVNELGTLIVLESAHREGASRFILSSSSAVYGDTEELPVTEEIQLKPLSPYAVQKWTGETYCKLFARQFGLETTCLRYFNVFGPRQDPSSPYSGVISKFMNCAVHDMKPTIYGNGDQTRDFVYVKDVVKANLLASTGAVTNGDALNIGTGKSITIRHLWETISSKADTHIDPEYHAPRTGDIHDSVASIREAENRLGYKPTVRFDDAIDHTLKWYRNC